MSTDKLKKIAALLEVIEAIAQLVAPANAWQVELLHFLVVSLGLYLSLKQYNQQKKP
jgi:hypothetical protein